MAWTGTFRVVERRTAGVALAALLMLCLGCGRGGSARYAAQGTVVLDGRPLRAATIIFEPVAAGPVVAAAVVDGRFEWTRRDGPVEGDHHVRINPHAVEEAEALEIFRHGRSAPMERFWVPARYQQPGVLTARVTGEGPNRFEFLLQSP